MRQLTDTLASSLRLLEVVPDRTVGLTVDFSNLAFAGERMGEVVAKLSERMYHAHVKNGYLCADGSWDFRRLDDGLVSYDELLPLLRGAGYEGYLSVECLGPAQPEELVARARCDGEILMRLLAGA